MVNERGNRPLATMLASMVGLGSYWAWMNLSAANAMAFPWLVESLYPPQLLLSSSLYLVAMVLLFFSKRFPLAGNMRRLEACGAACALLGSLATVLGTLTGVPWARILGALTSFGTAVLLVCWGSFFSRCPSRNIAIMTAGSFVWGTLVYLAFSEFLGNRLVYALPVLIALFGGILLVLEVASAQRAKPLDSDGAAREEKAVASRGVVVVLGCLGLCVVLNEVLRIMATPLAAADFSRVGSLTQFGGLLLSVVALASLLVSKKPFSFSAMAFALVPLMMAGFLSFLVFSGGSSQIVFILLGAGYWCLNMLVWIVLCDTVRRTGENPIRSFALFYGIIQVAILLAKPLGDGALRYVSMTPSGLALVVSVSVLVMVIASMLLLQNRRVAALLALGGEGGGVRDRDGRAHALVEGSSESSADRFSPLWLTAMAERYGLTPRETEVFLLLARGRSLPVIREELSIATGTAQTHIRHVYEKMGIHSRQEFFDCIEAEMGTEGA